MAREKPFWMKKDKQIRVNEKKIQFRRVAREKYASLWPFESVILGMFTSWHQLARKSGKKGVDRFEFLQELVNEFYQSTSLGWCYYDTFIFMALWLYK